MATFEKTVDVTVACVHCSKPNDLTISGTTYNQNVHCSHCGKVLGVLNKLDESRGRFFRPA